MIERVEVTVTHVECRTVTLIPADSYVPATKAERRTATMSGGYNKNGVTVQVESYDPTVWERFALGTRHHVTLTPAD